MNKTETIENFEIKYKKHIFSKSIKITLKKGDFILVTMPYVCPYKTAREFLLSNFKKIKSFNQNKEVIPKDFRTKFDTLKIIPSDELKTIKKDKIIHFYYPKNEDFSSKQIQKELSKAYLEALKIEAKNYLSQRLEFLAKMFDFKYNKISLRNQRTRFGSFSYQNNICLNINLMKYDFDIIDYVLIHELCHTKIKNHSQKFWNEVNKYCPNYKELRKRLKNKY